MIKLTDLLKELDLRPGELGGSFATDTNMYISFFNDFNFENADLMDELSDEQLEIVFNSEADQSEVKGKILSEVGDYRLLEPKVGMTKFMVNTSGKTWKEYIVGSVDVEVMKDKPYRLRGGQIVLTYICEPYRGKGIGTLMYYMIL